MTGLLKALRTWLVYGVLLLAAAAVMLLGRADPSGLERVRLQVTDTLVPILDVLSRPIDGLVHIGARIQGWVWLAEENAQLKAERERLRQWQAAAQRLEAENASLRALLDYVAEPATTSRTARVIANATNAFAHSVVVAAGAGDGIEKGQIAVTGDGLVGRVAAVSPRAALVLLITDLNSRVPVFVGPARLQAILAGDNSERPKLLHRAGDGVINVGDEVVTSGLAGGFPPAQPIGVVDDTTSTAISVRPHVDRNRLEYLRFIRYPVPPPPALPEPGGQPRKGPVGGAATPPGGP